MQEYTVHITSQVRESVDAVVAFKISCGSTTAQEFSDSFYDFARTLTTFPNSGCPISKYHRGQLYREHVVAYRVTDDAVYVVDIVDPHQHS